MTTTTKASATEDSSVAQNDGPRTVCPECGVAWDKRYAPKCLFCEPTTDTPRTDEKKWCAYCGAWGDHQSGYCVPFLRDREVTLTHQLADARLEVERLRDAFSHLANEIECTPKCASHSGDHCDCGRLERAYAISDSIPQNPTK